MNPTGYYITLALLGLMAVSRASGDERAEQLAFFEKRIRPVLAAACYECHSAASSKVKGGLRLDSRELIRRGGETGPAVVPGDTKASILLKAIRHEGPEMPPDKERLPANVLADFTRWIEMGAPDPRDQPPSEEEAAELSWQTKLNERRHWWSLQPVVAAKPSVKTENLIDGFIVARQRTAGLQSVNEADARVLARRLALVLTGLPPKPDAVERFVVESEHHAEKAYAALVDRLLASPHFGEHWARHWLDVVRFAETHGYEWNHEIRDAWRYRDYMIRAFNHDVPYDQLVREHIAGDLLENPRMNEALGLNESLIGTAFWRFGELGHDNCVTFPAIRLDALDDQIDTFSKAFQALTVSCARCHDHKLDAISTKDYYALAAMLENCSQVVHTLDAPGSMADAAGEARRIKAELRQQLGKTWLAAIGSMPETIRAALAGSDSPLTTAPKGKTLGRENPGYVLKHLMGVNASGGGRFNAARWIWDQPNAFQNEPSSAPIYFRFVFDLSEVPKKAALFATADDLVISYLNGRALGNNPAWQTPARYDLNNQLKQGRNVVAFEAANGVGPAGFMASLVIDGKERGSSKQWKVTRTLANNWTALDFDDSAWVAASEMGPSSMAPWRLVKPSSRDEGPHAGDIPAEWKKLAGEYRAEHGKRKKTFAKKFDDWAHFDAKPPPGWSISGLGLSGGPSRSGAFVLAEEGAQVVTAILPAGLHTEELSRRMNGSVRSPWLPADKKFVSVQVVGDRRSMVRTVVESCSLNEFAGGGLTYLNGGEMQWRTFPTSAAAGLRSFVELTTRSDNPRWPDRPGRAGSADPKEVYDYRSSFGIVQAVLHDAPGGPTPDLSHMVPLFEVADPVDVDGIAAAYQAVARRAITAWMEDRATDTDVPWLNWLLRMELLPNTTGSDPQLDELVTRYRELTASLPDPRVIAGLADQADGRGFPVLQGGELNEPGAMVPARYLEAIAGTSAFDTAGSGRRELAEQIASAANPLTARVMVNRIWHHLFGRGLVATTDDFGRMGDEPTHPELLDYIAHEFVQDDWSVKRLIRRVVMSETFRQTSRPHGPNQQRDPGNRLLHHYPARRLDAEAIRDTILAVSGRLDATLYGPGIHPNRSVEKDYRKLFSGPLDGNGRRSIYIKVTRMDGPRFLELFDFPTRMATRGTRDRTNVPEQALAMLNDPFVLEQAVFWAQRVLETEHDSLEECVTAMLYQATGRPPTDEERERFVGFIRGLAGNPGSDDATLLHDKAIWQDAAHAIFNLKEMIYIQ